MLLTAILAGVVSVRRPDIVDAYRVALAGGDPEPVARASVQTMFLAVFLGVTEEKRFAVVDVFVDSGDAPLAAWQVEVTANARIVGMEGEPVPTYDPAALQGGRIVLAAFSTAEKPPKGRVRVARLHMMEAGLPDYAVKLVAAAAPGGRRIEAKAEIGGTR
ncbi:MAG: hypothetical protein HYY16_07550 [Planctomycetes bacterium]|nr:hypothetical protein [Planctomycetota bacterium]